MPTNWIATDPSLFFSKKDPSDIRLGDCVRSYQGDLKSVAADLFVWGYPDHEGIQLNGGRIGAGLAPSQIRTVFYKMTPHVLIRKKPSILDLGNVDTSLSLLERHNQGAALSELATDTGLPWAALGGGHDYGYADGAGFLRAQLKKGLRPVVINFDAHLDVRPTTNGLNSGTPFYRLLSEFSGKFDFFEVGLQPHCNSQTHWDWALNQGAHLIPLSQVEEEGLVPCLQKALHGFQNRPLWLSLDIDAIQSSEAPGCSQSWTTGLKTSEIFDLMKWLADHLQWKAFSIYEVSPPLDTDNRTSKLSAQFLHHYLSLQQRHGRSN